MTVKRFHIKLDDHDAAPALNNLLKTMKKNAGLRYKQLDKCDFLVMFEYEHDFDHVFDRFYDVGDWIRT